MTKSRSRSLTRAALAAGAVFITLQDTMALASDSAPVFAHHHYAMASAVTNFLPEPDEGVPEPIPGPVQSIVFIHAVTGTTGAVVALEGQKFW